VVTDVSAHPCADTRIPAFRNSAWCHGHASLRACPCLQRSEHRYTGWHGQAPINVHHTTTLYKACPCLCPLPDGRGSGLIPDSDSLQENKPGWHGQASTNSHHATTHLKLVRVLLPPRIQAVWRVREDGRVSLRDTREMGFVDRHLINLSICYNIRPVSRPPQGGPNHGRC
jgi:hypothetical protein